MFYPNQNSIEIFNLIDYKKIINNIAYEKNINLHHRL